MLALWRRVVGPPALAEDAAQETVLAAMLGGGGALALRVLEGLAVDPEAARGAVLTE